MHRMLAALAAIVVVTGCGGSSQRLNDRLDQPQSASTTQALPIVAPADIGLSVDGVRAMDELMIRYTEPDRFPSLMLLVARGGKIGYWRAFGVRDLTRGDKLEHNDGFRIFSLTKPITATAILMLWEEGKLNLDDPVGRYVPAIGRAGVYTGPGTTRPPRQQMTIQHLLTFTSGLSYGSFSGQSAADEIVQKANLDFSATDLDDLMHRLGDLPLVGDPGDTFSYGFQTDVLGKVVEAVSGITLDEFFQHRIFHQLAMHETAFITPRTVLNRYPALYQLAEGHAPERVDPGDDTSSWVKAPRQRPAFRYLSGGGGLVSTPADYIRFAQMLANGGELDGVRLLKKSTVDSMHFPHVRTDSPRMTNIQGPGWAAGFQVMIAPDINAAGGGGHDGLYWMSGSANLYMWIDPAVDVVGMVWAQAVPYHVYPLFADTRRTVAEAFQR